MKKQLIAGNWKMNGSRAFVREFCQTLLQASPLPESTDIALFPPFVYLAECAEQLQSTAVAVGAQNVAATEEGAYTGEVSAKMLRDCGSQYVILGHSERRQYQQEDDALLQQKFKQAVSADLTPILCVGESLQQYQAEQSIQTVTQQLTWLLNQHQQEPLTGELIIAYEPIWAIGSGLAATPEHAQMVHQTIREQIAQVDKNLANSARLLYGGSVNVDNSQDLLRQADIDGALIGGASLKPRALLQIIEIAAECVELAS